MFEIVWNVWTAESLRHFVIPETVSAEKRSEPLSEEPSGEGLTTGVYGYECSGMDEYECTGTLVVFFKFATTCWLFSLVRDRRSTRYSHLCTARNWKNYCVTRILDSRWSLLGWLTNFQLVNHYCHLRNFQRVIVLRNPNLKGKSWITFDLNGKNIFK